MDSQLISETNNQKDNDVVAMGEPSIPSQDNKKKKNIIISVVVALVLIIVITLILVFTIKRKKDNKDGSTDAPKSDETEEEEDDDEDDRNVTVLDPLVYNSSSGNHTHTIIFMPGYSNQPEDFNKVFTQKINFTKKNDTTIIVLRSPFVNITYNHKMNYSWYDIYGIPLRNLSDINLEDLINSSKILKKVIKNEVSLLNGNYKKIIVGGHSQGASIALYQAYIGKKKLGGVFAFSGFLPPGEVKNNKRTLNGYLGYGDHDNVIDPAFTNKTIERIKDFEGFHLYIYKNHKHHVCTNQIIDVSKFLDNIIK